jgi:hypothetical protein
VPIDTLAAIHSPSRKRSINLVTVPISNFIMKRKEKYEDTQLRCEMISGAETFENLKTL